jgi:hypothetical protein
LEESDTLILPVRRNQSMTFVRLLVDAYDKDPANIDLFKLYFTQKLIDFCWIGVKDAYFWSAVRYITFLAVYSVSVAWFHDCTKPGSSLGQQIFAWILQGLIMIFLTAYTYSEIVQIVADAVCLTRMLLVRACL